MRESHNAGMAPRFFLFFGNPEISDLLQFTLESHFHCVVRQFGALQDILAALKQERPELILVDGSRADASTLLEAAKNLGCKVAVYHPKKEAPLVPGLDLFGVFNEPELLPGITAALRQFGAQSKKQAHEDGNLALPFFRVSVPLLIRTNPLVADIYIKLSDLKYIKLFHKGDPFGPEDVKKYHDLKKIEFFYVRKEESEIITNTLNNALENILQQAAEPMSISTPVSVATIETSHSLVSQVGFTSEVQRMVKNNVDLVVKEMHSSPSLSNILKNMDLDKSKYIASHSHMLAEVACAFSIAMKWDSEENFKKLTMAALLHDMCLTNQNLARVKDLKELNERRSEFTSDDVEEYRAHPRRAYVLVQGMKEIPSDVDKIIIQHHELPSGLGFPDHIQAMHFHPLSCLMLVAHDLVDWLIDHPSSALDMDGFIEAHSSKYKVGTFLKVLKAIASLQG